MKLALIGLDDPLQILVVDQGDEVLRLRRAFRPGRDRRIARAVEDAVEGVVIGLVEDRVEFVVVAPGATDAQTEDGLADVVEYSPRLSGETRRQRPVPSSDRQVSRRDDLPVLLAREP